MLKLNSFYYYSIPYGDKKSIVLRINCMFLLVNGVFEIIVSLIDKDRAGVKKLDSVDRSYARIADHKAIAFPRYTLVPPTTESPLYAIPNAITQRKIAPWRSGS